MSETQLAWPASHDPLPSDEDGVRQRQPNRRRGQGQRKSGHRDEWLTVDEVCAELNIGRRTFERWRTLGIAPRATRPTRNGPLRIRRAWLEEWAEDGAR